MKKGSDALVISCLFIFSLWSLFGSATEAMSYRTNQLRISLPGVQTVFWPLQVLKPKRTHEPLHAGRECWVRAGVTGLGVKDDLFSVSMSWYVLLGNIVCFQKNFWKPERLGSFDPCC